MRVVSTSAMYFVRVSTASACVCASVSVSMSVCLECVSHVSMRVNVGLFEGEI